MYGDRRIRKWGEPIKVQQVYEPDKNLRDRCRSRYCMGGVVEAVRYYKSMTGCSLREAHDTICIWRDAEDWVDER